MRSAWLFLALGLVSGCALRDAPYRFRAPGVSGVQVGALERRNRPRAHDDQAAPSDPIVAAANVGYTELERTPDQHGNVTAGNALADTLRAMVGLREPDATNVGFAMSALATLGAAIDDDVRAAADGPALVAMAEARHATATDHEPLLGDLVVFDRVSHDQPASGLGVVVSTRDDGTVEFVYLARGVVRRGFMNRERADLKRDENGRALNTIIRERSGAGRKGQGDLTAQVFATFIRLDALSDR